MGLIQQIESIPAGLANGTGTLGSVIQQTTQAALALAFPNDVEAFALTLQLIDRSTPNTSIQSFTFPVMPESLMMAQRYLMTVTTTLGGNYVDDFGRAPSPITLSGTFGRKVRNSGVSGSLTSLSGAVSLLKSAGAGLTTGYGMAKRLSDLVDQSHVPQNGLIPTLVLYNWAFNSHWEVVADSLDIKMDVQQNGLWFYQLSMRALQPAQNLLISRFDQVVDSAVQTLTTGVLDASVGLLLGNAATAVASTAGAVTKSLSSLRL